MAFKLYHYDPSAGAAVSFAAVFRVNNGCPYLADGKDKGLVHDCLHYRWLLCVIHIMGGLD